MTGLKILLILVLLPFGIVIGYYAPGQNNTPESNFSYNESYAGEMDEFGNIIVYNKYLDLWRKDLVWYHERCHVIFRFILDYSEVEEYKQIFLRSGKPLKDIDDHFAETCRKYITLGELDEETTMFFNKIKPKLQLLKLRKP